MVNPYPTPRPLRLVRWSAGVVERWNRADHRHRDTWTQQGVPADATFCCARTETIHAVGGSMQNIVFVYEYPTWELIEPGAEIPEQRVVFLDVRGALARFQEG